MYTKHTLLDESVTAAPGISPGIVKDEECLIRELYKPEHVDNDGNIIKRAIPIDHLKKGFSFHRKEHVSKEFVENSILQKLSKARREPWTSAGVSVIKVFDVRQLLMENDEKVFKVIDKACVDNPTHANIYFSQPGKPMSYLREARGFLLRLLQNQMSLDEAFECCP